MKVEEKSHLFREAISPIVEYCKKEPSVYQLPAEISTALPIKVTGKQNFRMDIMPNWTDKVEEPMFYVHVSSQPKFTALFSNAWDIVYFLTFLTQTN